MIVVFVLLTSVVYTKVAAIWIELGFIVALIHRITRIASASQIISWFYSGIFLVGSLRAGKKRTLKIFSYYHFKNYTRSLMFAAILENWR